MNNVRDFGAVGNGVASDTAAIQRAIDAGGVVHFPPGVYLTGTIYLRSNGGLDLDPGATLLASPDLNDYNADDFCAQNVVYSSEQTTGAHLIIALEQENIVLRGGGKINGSGKSWLCRETQPDGTVIDTYPRLRPGQLIYFCESSQIRVQDITIEDAPYWALMFHGCCQVMVRNVRIASDFHGHNGDGITIDCSRQVTISDCQIEGSDDCITLRGCGNTLKGPGVTEYVTVSNCILRTQECGIRVGVGSGLVRRAVFSNIVIRGASVGVNICSRWKGGIGVTVEDVSFHDFFIDTERPFNITNVVAIVTGNVTVPGSLSGIDIRHWRGRASRSGNITGRCGGIVRNVKVQDVALEIHGDNCGATAEGSVWYDGSPAYTTAFHVENAERVMLRDVTVSWADDAENWSDRGKSEYDLTV